MKTKKLILAGIALLLAGTAIYALSDGHAQQDNHEHEEGDEHGHEAGGEHEEGSHAEISPEAAEAAGLKVEQVGPGKVAETLALNGRLNFHPNYLARLQARYPGIVRSLKVNVGDKVTEGQVLATVESNDSLNTYSLKSPIKGTVIQRNGSVGENTGDAPVLVVADPSQFWFALYIFPSDAAKVKTDQKVIITSLDGQYSTPATITSILPDADSDTPLTVAQGKLDNTSGVWVSGSAITGKVVIEEEDVALAIKSSALQTAQGKPVVYVKEGGNKYEARNVNLGLNDGIYAEVLEGLKAGEEYVTENSYLVKADIEKAGAGHDH